MVFLKELPNVQAENSYHSLPLVAELHTRRIRTLHELAGGGICLLV